MKADLCLTDQVIVPCRKNTAGVHPGGSGTPISAGVYPPPRRIESPDGRRGRSRACIKQ